MKRKYDLSESVFFTQFQIAGSQIVLLNRGLIHWQLDFFSKNTIKPKR